MFSPMPPPLTYYGGKQKLAPKIIPLIPRHTVYVEPFAGGATILFRKPWPKVTSTSDYREFINDTDSRLVNFYKVLQDPFDRYELLEKLLLTPYSEEMHKITQNMHSGDNVDRAWSYYVNLQKSFGCDLGGGWGTAVFSKNNACTWAKKVTKLPEYLDRMRDVFISNRDALKLIRDLDSPQTFFYCDPPYPETFCGHYKGYTLDDYRKLVETLKVCQGSFLLSNYEQANVKIPAEWERFDFSVLTALGCKKNKDRSLQLDLSHIDRNRTEVVWRRFNRVPVRPEIQKLYDSGAFDCFASPDSAWEF